MIVHAGRGLGHAPADGSGDDVARREVLERVDTGHHPLAGGVVEDRSFAAHRFGDERLLAGGVRTAPHHRRVELHELDVAHGEPGAQGDRRAVARDRRRVRRRREDLAEAAGGEHDGAGGHRADGGDAAGRVEQGDGDAGRLATAVVGSAGDEVEGEGPLEHVDAGRDRRFVERALDLGAGTIAAGVDDAVVAVAALAGERRAEPVVARVERRTEAHEVADRRRRLGHELADDGLVAQPGAGRQRVADVLLERVGRVEDTGQATLGPRRRAGVEDVLGDDQHAAHRPHGEGGGEPGGTRSEHDDVDVALPRRRRRGQACAGSPHSPVG